ncbi:type II restriction endonuclease [Campylobacter upsaliensis]|nr:type II restriction endonuclease [Campylobacter upsaliensis]
MDKANSIGSQTAKDGFKNEAFVVAIFNDWKNEPLAGEWLKAMGYDLKLIEEVRAEKIKGQFKADVQVVILVQIKLQKLQDVQNIQVKLVSSKRGFNQTDKRTLESYDKLWNFPSDIYEILQYFVGEKEPKIANPKDKRRMWFNEFSKEEQDKILNFFKANSTLILSDILKGRGKFVSEWFLVIQKIENEPIKWTLKPINEVLNFYNGEVFFTRYGNIKIGKVGIQRKGGDGGRESAKMLQFKIDPTLLLK